MRVAVLSTKPYDEQLLRDANEDVGHLTAFERDEELVDRVTPVGA